MWTYFSFEGGGVCQIDFFEENVLFLEIIYAKVEHC